MQTIRVAWNCATISGKNVFPYGQPYYDSLKLYFSAKKIIMYCGCLLNSLAVGAILLYPSDITLGQYD